MTKGNWIKINRQLLNNPIAKKPLYGWLWIVLLIKANHEDKEFIWNNKKQICKRGQLITGRKQLSIESGISESSVENILKYFEIEHQIEQQKTNKFRLISVKNYDVYQGNEQEIEQLAIQQGIQQNDTNKNIKNIKNIKERNKSEETSQETVKPVSEIQEVFNTFYEAGNKGINFGNKTERAAAEWLVKEYGLKKTVSTIKYAMSIAGKPYAPVITTPFQLKNNIAKLMAYYKREQEPKKGTAPEFKFI